MARKPAKVMTEGELQIMEVLWERGPSTVRQIQRALDEPLVDSTIRTFLGIAIRKGYVTRHREGRAFVYEARVAREESRQRGIRNLVDRMFATPAELTLDIIESGDLDRDEIERIKRAIEERVRREGVS